MVLFLLSRQIAFNLFIKSRGVNRGSFLRAENYVKHKIIEELKKAGFEKIQVFLDVAGKHYDEEASTMCIVVEK